MLIPRLIHQIWLGTAPPHHLMLQWRQRWQALHPSWQVVIWRELESGSSLRLESTSQLSPIVPGAEQFDLLARACHLAQRANIWRYLVLLQHGGLYIDHDLEPLLPLDSLANNCAAFTARRQNTPYLMCENAFMGAEPSHPWIAELVAKLTTKDPATSLSMGCDYLTEITTHHPEVAIFPEDKIVFVSPANWEAAKSVGVVPSSKNPLSNGPVDDQLLHGTLRHL
jgi:mannosyltransferase OCH1-like enzyme